MERVHRVCSCGRRLVRVFGAGALDVAPVAALHREPDGTLAMGPAPSPYSWRHSDNTPECPDEVYVLADRAT